MEKYSFPFIVYSIDVRNFFVYLKAVIEVRTVKLFVFSKGKYTIYIHTKPHSDLFISKYSLIHVRYALCIVFVGVLTTIRTT